MAIKYPDISKNRHERLLHHQKGFRPLVGRGTPSRNEGSDGDIRINKTTLGVRLYVKISGKWYGFKPESELPSLSSNVLHFVASADGTVAIPSISLTKDDSGKTFFIGIASNTAVFKLPPVSLAGVNYKFILDFASDGENTKDFAIITNATAENIVGNVMVAGAILNITNVSTVQIDTNVGVANYGDWLSVISDGAYWYIDGSTLTASSIATNAGHSLA
jgi:hypothetical protein